MIEQYRVYDRQTLSYVDGGVIRDYVCDFDYLCDNASTLTLTEETYAKKGDIVTAIRGTEKLFLGVVTAVDNTKKTISFKHMKELFNDTALNPFKFTGSIGYKFDAVTALKTILDFAFVTTDDEKKKLPLIFETQGTAPGAVWNDDGDTLPVADFIQFVFDSHNVYLDFDIDFENNKIICRIIKNTYGGYILKDNIRLSEPAFDRNELPAHNKAVVYDKDTGAIKGTYYLLSDNTVTDAAANANRLLPVSTKYIEYDAEKGVSAFDLATSELQGNIYNHAILYKLSKEQRLVSPLRFNIGDTVKIIYREREYDSIFTGLKFNKSDPYYTCIFGKTRIDFTDRLKLYIEKRYRKK